MKIIRLLVLIFLTFGCSQKEEIKTVSAISTPPTYLQVLGVAQDAGFPQINCKKDCCKKVWGNKALRKMVSCLGIVDEESNIMCLFDATPDIRDQLNILDNNKNRTIGGVFLTHAHIGHYTGLMHFGREAMGADSIPVYAMPRMKKMLEDNAPWSQLVDLKNIDLKENMEDGSMFEINNSKDQLVFSIQPFLVPHRDEFSETVGFRIIGKNKSALFIPDIDKWEKWDRDIIEEIKKVDYAFLDGTFFENGEIPGRDMSLIPHPFVEESMKLFENLTTTEKNKVYFIHFNHTNPILQKNSEAQTLVEKKGFHIAEEGQIFEL